MQITSMEKEFVKILKLKIQFNIMISILKAIVAFGYIFENFRKMCLKIINQTIQNFFQLAPGLAWQAALKNTEVNLELLTDIDMLLMIEKGIKGGICNTNH